MCLHSGRYRDNRMSTVLKTRIIRIGNSQGIRIPKLVINQIGLGDEVQVEVQPDHLIIRPAGRPRQGWNEAFQAMAKQRDDRLLDSDLLPSTQWEKDEWEW
jgi:antitoxin MazE